MDYESEINKIYSKIKNPRQLKEKDLSKILYTMHQKGLFIDEIDSMSVQQAINIWKIIEFLKNNLLPNNLIL